MVLTVAVRMVEERGGPSRRTVLRAALGGLAGTGALAACDTPQSAAQEQKTPDPLNALYRDTAALLARYEATIAAQSDLADRLGPVRDDHRAHLQALAREIGPGLDAASSAHPAAEAGASAELTDLVTAEKDAAAAARTACLSAPSYRAALLGSIAAARASHVAVLS